MTPLLAMSIARATVNRASRQHRPQALWNRPNGVFIRSTESTGCRLWMAHFPEQLIGIYDNRATILDVQDDILAATEVHP